MSCIPLGRDRRGMTISVTILGLAVLTILLAYLAFGDNNDQSDIATVRFVAIIHRHGDRAPTDAYPNDPHKNYAWPGGWGALSQKGSLQMYNLGTNLRLRYYRLLPSNGLYTKENMFVLSSAAERCLMSAQSFLAGFLPPLTNQNNLPIIWQPVAINSVPRDRDNLIAQKMACPKYDEIFRTIETNPPIQVQEINKKNAQLYAYLTEHTGQNVTSIANIEKLYNILAIQNEKGLSLPDWCKEVFPDKMLPLAERYLAWFSETSFMRRVKGGSLVTQIVDNMIKKRNKLLSPNRSLFIYSAHDLTLVNVMYALNIIEQTSGKPNYGATLALEMHHSVQFEDDFEVKIFYYFNYDDKIPKELSITNCTAPCSLTKFVKTIDKILIHNYNETCQLAQ